MTNMFAWTVISLLAVSCTIYTVFSVFLLRASRSHRRLRVANGGELPRVSIMKPIGKAYDGMEEDISSFFELSYPDYEIVFGLDRCGDECLPVIERLKARYPGVRTVIVRKETSPRLNPKIEVLSLLEPCCNGSLFWVSDVNVRVPPDTLSRLVEECAAHDSKLVYSPIRGTGSRTIASAMENSFMNFFISGAVVASSRMTSRHLVIGKSMLIERAALEEFGGFSYFGRYLAEDYMMGLEFEKRGFHVSTNDVWITNYVSSATVRSFLSRMRRWSSMRARISPVCYVLEMFAYPVAIAALLAPWLGVRGLLIFAAVAAYKTILEYVVLFSINTEDRKKAWVIAGYPAFTVARDMAVFVFCYLGGVVMRRVKWNDRSIRIGRYSLIDAVQAAR